MNWIYCHPAGPVEGCPLCRLAQESERHRAVLLRVPGSRAVSSAGVKSGCGGCGAKTMTAPPNTRLDELRHALDHPTEYPGGEGDGILYVGGGKYWPGIVIGCRLIRELGCQWPVQVWYRGSVEPIRATDVRGLDVELIDADKLAEEKGDRVVKGGPSYRGGWEAKAYAITHTSLRRVLYLDADAYPVSSPCALFSLLDTRPFVYWEDTGSNAVRWQTVLPECERVGSIMRNVQGGQLLIDRERAWPLVSLFRWVCDRSAYYWGGPRASWLMYGDQDAWKVGMAAGVSPYRNLGPAAWRGVAFVCEWDGKARVVHRCGAKLFPGTKPKTNSTLPLEGRVMQMFRELTGAKP